ncbi:sulfonate ABC transporter substrate-binding protein [Nostocaceae cyanobacterium CENA369]|uniref:Putative aliphatic sulfonates-binding protein n=1 Tax=Dendronalium phyllosphericum CENA369 TaxID=1725256 RepID=A0A8J7LI12_9NOST|nr:sulfonate ABC transporter substrate-binding protein [Dendronalium phyllosphericum]MBH8576673.1 sulfonate ABC transporter substrate-binding protein [Dendronalium phyllosphericum CENA369]
MLAKYSPARLIRIISSFVKNYRISINSIFALFFALGLGLSLISACSPNNTSNSPATQTVNQKSTNQAVVVRIGYQKAATILNALKNRRTLEKTLAAAGASVTWAEFPAGPPMLEAMNAGSIDFGYTGESPPIFAQAGGTPLLYIAYDPWSPKAEAIIVPKNSPIKSVAELKGKKIAFAKGSNSNYLVVKAIETAGLKYSDIKPAYLAPADARAAFEGGNVDAWAIWDPYLAVAQQATGARTITDATNLAPNRGYYLARQAFVDSRSDLLKTVLDEVSKLNNWAANNPKEVAKFLEPELGIKAAVLEIAEKRREYGVLPLTDKVIATQQDIADTFHKIKLIPKQIQVKEIVWKGNK